MSEIQMPGLVPTRFVADYQMFGDMEGLEWGELIFRQAKRDLGIVIDYQILSSVPGTHGIQFVTFTVDLQTPISEFRTMEEACDWATTVLNSIINDSDVEVRWAGHPAEKG